jgi:hypothetical protein
MGLYTGVPCAMTRHARGAQHRGECRGPRGNGGGGGSQQPAETWGASADHSGHSGSRETAEIAGDAPPRSAGPSPATYRSPSPLSAHDLARRAVADESDTSSPNRSRQRPRVSPGDSQHLRRFLSLMPIEQRVPHSSNSSQHSCPTLPAPLSSGSETDSSRATKSGQSTSQLHVGSALSNSLKSQSCPDARRLP